MDQNEYEKALLFVQRKEFIKALDSFSRVIQISKGNRLSLLSAHQAAEVALYKVKDYEKAIGFFKFIVLFSPKRKAILKAQEKIGKIYFEKLNDYIKAIETFTHLLAFANEEEKKNSYKIYIVRSYYYLKNFSQAEVEVNLLLQEKSLNHQENFDVHLLKANILLSIKKVEEALGHFQRLERTYPELAKEEKIGMSVVICYEELQKYDEAIAKLLTMRSLYSSPHFIDLQIEKLKKRRSNMPGYYGLRGMKRVKKKKK